MNVIRRRLLLVGFPLLELITIYVVAQVIGWGWTALLLIAAIPAGLAVMRNAAEAAVRAATLAQQHGQIPDLGTRGVQFLAGILIAVPGFWSDVAGAVLLVPWVRRRFRARASRWLDSRVTTVRMPGIRFPERGEIIEGTVIRRDDEPLD